MTTPSKTLAASAEKQGGMPRRPGRWKWVERAAAAATMVSALLATKGGQAAAFLRAFER